MLGSPFFLVDSVTLLSGRNLIFENFILVSAASKKSIRHDGLLGWGVGGVLLRGWILMGGNQLQCSGSVEPHRSDNIPFKRLVRGFDKHAVVSYLFDALECRFHIGSAARRNPVSDKLVGKLG